MLLGELRQARPGLRLEPRSVLVSKAILLRNIVFLTSEIELFLPSYADYESQDLERKQDPVQDIVLTEEEIAAMFPQ